MVAGCFVGGEESGEVAEEGWAVRLGGMVGVGWGRCWWGAGV